MNLVIVESPAKAKTLKKYLGDDFKIEASFGHVIDLPKKELGVDIEHDFEPKYDVMEGKEKVLKKLKNEAKKSENIYLASDPDREGEAIAWHIANHLKIKKTNIKRVLFYEITKEAVLKSINNPEQLDENRFNAQQTRRILDRIVGYKVSPLLWKKIRRGLSAGRVQTVTLRLICEREKEIQAFKPEEYWSVKGIFLTGSSQELESKLFKIGNKSPHILNSEQADQIVNNIKASNFHISSVERKEKKRNPLPPYTTSKLQQEASTKINFRPYKTMQVAQTLYEGVDIGEQGSVGLITYMRTDSVRISPTAIDSCRKFISEKFGKSYLPSHPKEYSIKSTAQDAHEAIRPTSVEIHPENIKKFLTNDQYKLYKLIWERFVASQMKSALYDQTTIDITDTESEYTFRTTGSILKFDGFLKVFSEESDDKLLPTVNQGDPLKIQSISPQQHFTEPPPRYTESTLVKALEEKGIGRPSTYAPILQNIQERKYAHIKEKKLYPTEIGMLINDMLIESFPEIFDVNFTAQLENKLDDIESSKFQWRDVLSEFYHKFDATLKSAYQNMSHINQITEESDFVCEKCGNKMIIKWSRNGRFLACSNYPECKNTKQFKVAPNGELEIVKDEVLNEKCPKCGNSLLLRNGKYGKFISCEKYPECNFSKPISIMPCPEDECSGVIVQRRSKKGRVFYGCSNYPKCKFVSWYEPVNQLCSNCGNRYMIKKHLKSGIIIQCPNKKCNYIEKDSSNTE